jgi:hypothetical protein
VVVLPDFSGSLGVLCGPAEPGGLGSTTVLVRPDRQILIAQAVICVLLLVGAAFINFPSPIPVLFLVAAVGVANAAFELMRTFGSALLGGVATASVAIAAVPFVTCSAGQFTDVFPCTGNAPTWHLTGSVVVAGLSGASLVLSRAAAHADERARLDRIERRLADVQQILHGEIDAELEAMELDQETDAELEAQPEPADAEQP